MGDYDELNELLESALWNSIDIQSDLDQDVKYLTDLITTSMEECIPSKNYQGKTQGQTRVYLQGQEIIQRMQTAAQNQTKDPRSFRL